jgi:hypothetical protein
MISLKVSTIDHHSLALTWDSDEETPITGYIISYKSHLDNWEEVKSSGKRSKYILDNLRCGTKYQMTVIAVNKAGRSKPSDVVSAATAGNGNDCFECNVYCFHLNIWSLPLIVKSLVQPGFSYEDPYGIKWGRGRVDRVSDCKRKSFHLQDLLLIFSKKERETSSSH